MHFGTRQSPVVAHFSADVSVLGTDLEGGTTECERCAQRLGVTIEWVKSPSDEPLVQ